MLDKIAAAKAALRNVPMLHEDFIEPAVRMLEAAGVLDSERGGDAMHARASFTDTRRAAVLTMVQAAADPRNVEMLRIVRANARRLGVGELFEDGSKPIDLHALNKGLSKAPLADRWRFREMLYSLRLIPA